jgi:hypothetical protein
MGAVSITTAKTPSGGTARSFRNQEGPLPTNSIVMRVAQRLWPTKTDQALAHKTGTSDRMCRYWLANKYKLSADDLAALLRSDEGFQILEAIIGEARPVWWRSFKRSVRRAELRRQQAAIQKALDEDEQGDLGI